MCFQHLLLSTMSKKAKGHPQLLLFNLFLATISGTSNYLSYWIKATLFIIKRTSNLIWHRSIFHCYYLQLWSNNSRLLSVPKTCHLSYLQVFADAVFYYLLLPGFRQSKICSFPKAHSKISSESVPIRSTLSLMIPLHCDSFWVAWRIIVCNVDCCTLKESMDHSIKKIKFQVNIHLFGKYLGKSY